MIIPIELRFKADKDSKSAFRTEKTIKSHDVNSVEFHITIDGLELTANHTAKILSVFHSSKSQVNVDCEIVEGKIVYKPDTELISMCEHVTSYVYVYNGNQSVDVCEFIYTVGLSKIDETSLKVKEVYDQSYADLLAGFEQALEDYKLTLPQADSVRAEIDAILNQFSEDSQVKLSLVNEAEQSRVQAEGQRESAESSRVQAETQRVSAESSRVSAEATRALAENERENAEAQRKTDHANRSAELDGKADKVVLKSLVVNGDFSNGTMGWSHLNSNVSSTFNEVSFIANAQNGRLLQTLNLQNSGQKLYQYADVKSSSNRVRTSIHGSNVVVYHSGSGQYEVLSSVHTQYTIGPSSQFQILDANDSGWTEIYVKNTLLINLTETFGVGNEPTKEEMDELIKVTGYIDGEYALNNKEMLIWTLALIRRNKDAIIALGGA